MDITSPQFWFAVFQIMTIDILLGGDNAVVIGLACRRLPERQRKLGIFWGMVGAIALRTGLIMFALNLLAIPYLKIAGASLLLWIGVKLLMPESAEEPEIDGGTTLFTAIKTIIIADAVMSMDNVIAISGAAGDNNVLVIFGLLLSVPIIVLGSQLVLKLMDRFPLVIYIGAAMLGWIAGAMFTEDAAISDWIKHHIPAAIPYAPIAGALFVVAFGALLASRIKGNPDK
ncbi:TerC family protein [Undibacterium sp. Jales W-56]|uniref:TerC family protein n=1 Tax=Undibacterium sp. Jales W-56 TaxID=2897325 RepID=UPI0021D177F7|nr:TerC family protein [Undibacterium sp. Jales W-56]MCU6433731.1 TerC family protein [Undibacterium sp. Jales W-56]